MYFFSFYFTLIFAMHIYIFFFVVISFTCSSNKKHLSPMPIKLCEIEHLIYLLFIVLETALESQIRTNPQIVDIA